MADIAVHTLLLLAAVAFVAGFVDSIAGGGGLIMVPALLLAGFPPVAALGTNKLQGLFGTASATLSYAARGLVDLRAQFPMAFFAFLGALLGAAVATILPVDALRITLPFLLVAIALYFAFRKGLDDTDRVARIGPALFASSIALPIGFYDGVFGPGAGSFYMIGYVTLAGFGVLKATAHTKLLNFASNLGGFVAFAIAGAVFWKVGLVMGFASFLGARLGSRLAIRNGARIIRPLLVITCIALTIRLLADETSPIRIWLAG